MMNLVENQETHLLQSHKSFCIRAHDVISIWSDYS